MLKFVAAAWIVCMAAGCQSRPPATHKSEHAASAPRVTAPPGVFFQKVREADRDAARRFYRKCIDVKGMPVTASAEVDDRALQRTYDVVTHLLAGRPAILQAMVTNDTIRRMFAYRHDILKAFIADGAKLVVLGRNEKLSDLPEFRNATITDMDLTARFADYSRDKKLLVVAEENVLDNPNANGVSSCEVIREFAKALCQVCGTRPIDPGME